MRRIIIIACSLLFFSIPLTVANAQDEEPPTNDYAGTRECRSCHREIGRDYSGTPHAFAMLDVKRPREKEFILADFEQDSPSILFPGEDEARPINDGDISYLMGSGRNIQRYIYEQRDRTLTVLPVQWNTNTSEWESFELSEEWPSEAYDFTTNCAGCHTTGLNVQTGEWVDPNIECEACHGPGAEHAALAGELPEEPDNEQLVELRGSIAVGPDARVCGQCHVRGIAPDGIHPYPVGYTPGMEFPNEDVFQIYDVGTETHWWETGHAKQPNMQFTEWLHSGHAEALETLQSSSLAQPECLSCHSADYIRTETLIAQVEAGERRGDAPESLTPETAQFGVTCMACHNPHSKADHLLIDEPLALCAACHSDEGDIYEGIHHPTTEFFEGKTVIAGVEGVPGTHFTEENGPNCITCHMMTLPMGDDYSRVSHVLDVVKPLEAEEGQLDTCTECHTTLTPFDLTLLMTDIQDSVRNRLTINLARITSVDEPEEDSATYVQYQQVRDALTFVQNEGSLGIHNYAYTDALLDYAEHELSALSVGGQADFSPTEAPAATATYSPEQMEQIFATRDDDVLENGVRPISKLIIAAVFIFLGSAGFIFFRQSAKSAAVIVLLMIISGLTTQNALAQEEVDESLYPSNDYCLLCHEDTSNTWELPSGEILSVDISLRELAESVHGRSNPEGPLNCVDCHIDQRFPHQTPAAQTAREFTLERYATCRSCHEDQYTHAQDSVHGEAVRAGRVEAAVCVDCHGGHDIQPPDEPRQRVSITCGKCHGVIFDEYRNSVHGAALIDDGNTDVPTCISCHTAHDVETTTNTLFRNRSPQLCATCHADTELMEAYGISTHVFDSYLTDFHGTTVALFEQQDESVPTNKAVCYDCHGVHNILPVDNENSQAVRENLLTTCQKCHPGATDNFPDSWIGHYPPTAESNPLLFYVNMFYDLLIPAVVGAFIFLIATDIIRRLRGGTVHHHEEGK